MNTGRRSAQASNRGAGRRTVVQLLLLCLLTSLSYVVTVGGGSANAADTTVTFQPGTGLNDDSGNSLQAHGSDVVRLGSKWYWYGSAPRDTNNTLPFAAFGGINVYSSSDLSNWHYEGMAVAPTSSGTLSNKLVAYNPRVLYNSGTQTYVMILSECCGDGSSGQLETGHLVYLTSSTPAGPFTFVRDEWPADISVYDMGSFQDDDGTAYVVYSDGNQGVSIDRLSSDYLSVAQRVAHFSSGQCEEAPTVVKNNGTYFLTNSYCSGWAPNQGHYRSAPSMAGPWHTQPDGNLGDATTYNTQAFDILPVQGTAGTTYIWIGDRWDCPQSKCDLSSSTYAWLPLDISGTTMTLNWSDPWYLDVTAGTWSSSAPSSPNDLSYPGIGTEYNPLTAGRFAGESFVAQASTINGAGLWMQQANDADVTVEIRSGSISGPVLGTATITSRIAGYVSTSFSSAISVASGTTYYLKAYMTSGTAGTVQCSATNSAIQGYYEGGTSNADMAFAITFGSSSSSGVSYPGIGTEYNPLTAGRFAGESFVAQASTINGAGLWMQQANDADVTVEIRSGSISGPVLGTATITSRIAGYVSTSFSSAISVASGTTYYLKAYMTSGTAGTVQCSATNSAIQGYYEGGTSNADMAFAITFGSSSSSGVSYPGIGTEYNPIYGGKWAGSSFVAVSPTISYVSVWILQANDADVAIEVRSGSISGPIIGSATITSRTSGKVGASLGSAVSVTPGATYYVRAIMTTGSAGTVQESATNPSIQGYYEGGTSNADMAFEVT